LRIIPDLKFYLGASAFRGSSDSIPFYNYGVYLFYNYATTSFDPLPVFSEIIPNIDSTHANLFHCQVFSASIQKLPVFILEITHFKSFKKNY